MGLPIARSDVKEFTVNAEDCEEIYDDVLPPGIRGDSTAVDEDDYLIPEAASEEPSKKEQPVELRTISEGRAKERDASTIRRSGDQYLLTTNNEYSSVDCDNHLSVEERDEMGVYDDVGLPTGEERVNSLYASSVLGLTSMNGKESEWEDLEEVSHCPGQANDPW